MEAPADRRSKVEAAVPTGSLEVRTERAAEWRGWGRLRRQSMIVSETMIVSVSIRTVSGERLGYGWTMTGALLVGSPRHNGERRRKR